MSRTSSRLVVAAVLALLTFTFAPSVEAQALRPGTWTGSMSNPVGGVVEVTFDVGGTADAPTISMSVSMLPEPIAFNDIRLEGSSMTFWWEPGVRVDCTLMRDAAGGFAGTCSDGSGSGEGRMTMVPPA
ncbi:MAG: hypothetical protein AB7T31_13890 [Gemmatimonadales bacterium]